MNGYSLTPLQEAAIECNLGLTEPGKCESCGKNGPRAKFWNWYTEKDIECNLCFSCMRKAILSTEYYLKLRQKKE